MILTLLLLVSIGMTHEMNYTPPPSLFTDKRAFRLGDIVTILLEEYSTGSNSARLRADYSNNFEFRNSITGKLNFLPGFGVSTDIEGDNLTRGITTRTGSLRGKIAGKVTEILQNGNLRLEGRRTIVVNGEEQITVLTGIVRPNDIKADNTIYSYMIADAQISYLGKGEINQAVKLGFLSRLLAWIF